MDPNAVVFDISSDEEGGWGENKGIGGGGGGDDFSWISKLLDEVDKEVDSDDVMFVGEVVVNPKPKNVAATSITKDLDDDNDCVVLDGDPDKPVSIDNNSVEESDSDELLVVSEKGQVACRDYPHPRHLCVKFPFTSTPHERYCDQCHCYVCDSLAPCLSWGIGISNTDHCHANDKEEFWKLQRNLLKNKDQASITVPDTSLPGGIPQTNQATIPASLGPNYLPQGQVPMPALIRACTASTNFGIPNIINQSRSHRTGCVVSRNKFRHSTCNNVTPRDRRHVGGGGYCLNSPRGVFKKTTGSAAGISLTSNRRYGSSQYTKNLHPVAAQNDDSVMGWHPNISNSSSSQPQVLSQPNLASSFVNSVPSQPLVSPQPNTGNIFTNPATSLPQVTSQPYVGSPAFESSTTSQPLVSSPRIVGSTFANTMPWQSQVCSQPNSVSNDYQNIFNLEGRSQSFLDSTSLVDIDLSWVSLTSRSDHHHHHHHQPPPAANSQLQDVGSSMAGVNFLSGSTNPVSIEFQYDNWTLDDTSSPVGALDVPVQSPEPGFFDI